MVKMPPIEARVVVFLCAACESTGIGRGACLFSDGGIQLDSK